MTIGSYPSYEDGKFRNRIVVRARSAEALAAAEQAVHAMLRELRAERISA